MSGLLCSTMSAATSTTTISVNRPSSTSEWLNSVEPCNLGQFSGQDKDPPDDGNEGNHQKGFDAKFMFAEQNLDGVQQLDDQQDEQHLIEHHVHLPDQRAPAPPPESS
jgi:hypothetical protein